MNSSTRLEDNEWVNKLMNDAMERKSFAGRLGRREAALEEETEEDKTSLDRLEAKKKMLEKL